MGLKRYPIKNRLIFLISPEDSGRWNRAVSNLNEDAGFADTSSII